MALFTWKKILLIFGVLAILAWSYVARWQWYALYMTIFHDSKIAKHYLILPYHQQINGLNVPKNSILSYHNETPVRDLSELWRNDFYEVNRIHFVNDFAWGEWQNLQSIGKYDGSDLLLIQPKHFTIKTKNYFCRQYTLLYRAKQANPPNWLPEHYTFSGCQFAENVQFQSKNQTYSIKNSASIRQLSEAIPHLYGKNIPVNAWFIEPHFDSTKNMKTEGIWVNQDWEMIVAKIIIRKPMKLGACEYGQNFTLANVYPAKQGGFEWQFDEPNLSPECQKQILSVPFGA